MSLLRRWLILTHRYLGIPLSALFVVWFASGIVMMYAGDMPGLTPELRCQRACSLCGMDVVALRHRCCIRPVHVDLGFQRIAVNGAVRLDERPRPGASG